MAFDIPDNESIFKAVHGKVVILTGGATGIGEATVRLLSRLGAQISFLDTNQTAGERLSKELGENVTFFHGSVLSWEDQVHIFEQTVKNHGRVDIVLANAGIDEVVEDAFIDAFDDQGKLKAPTLVVLDVNIRGTIFTTKLALSYFRRLNIKGSLVATGSAASYLDTPGIPVYNASKHGVIGLIRSLRDTLAEEGLVRTNVVAPWFTSTPFTEKLAPLWAKTGLPANTPEDIAKAIVYLAVHSDYHGKSLYVAGGRYTELEEPIQASRDIWLGEQNTAWIDLRKSAQIKLGKQGE